MLRMLLPRERAHRATDDPIKVSEAQRKGHALVRPIAADQGARADPIRQRHDRRIPLEPHIRQELRATQVRIAYALQREGRR